MNYNKLYDSIINKYGSINKPKSVYTERHHIIPKSLGGSNDVTNLVYVTAKVHFILHRLLVKIHPSSNKLKFAFWAMCNQLSGDVIRTYKVTSSTFEQAKIAFAKANSQVHKGKKMPKDYCDALSKRMIGNTINPKGISNPLYGTQRSDEIKNKISQTKKDNYQLNPSFKGFWVTPKGKFYSIRECVDNTNYRYDSVSQYCKNPHKLLTLKMVNSTNYFNYEDVGKPLSELGWGFEEVIL